MLLNMTSQFLNSTINSTNSMEIDYFTICSDMYEGVVFWACSSVVLSLFGFPACVTVLWELFQKHRRGTPTTPNDVFMLNLTVMDSVFLGFMPTSVCNYLFWHNRTFETFLNFLYSLSLSGRPLFMTCICLDCYLAVVHPIMYRARKGLTSRVLMCVVVWAVTLAYGTAFILIDGLYYQPIALWPQLITLPTIGFCDFFILRALKSSDPAGRDLHPQKKKALQIIINSLVMTVITYLPPLLAMSLQKCIPIREFICRVIFPMFILISAGSAIMPVLYLSNLRKLDFIYVGCCNSGSEVQ